MRIGVTGSTGLLGSALLKLGDEFDIKSVPIRWKDFFDLDSVSRCKMIESLELDALIHCAANTNVEQCEVKKEKAYRSNVELTDNILKSIHECHVKLVFISSTGNYGNYQTQPYIETDPLKPTTYHHMTKALAEQLVAESGSDFLILRTGWLFGTSRSEQRDFVVNRLNDLRSGQTVSSNVTQIGCPTYVNDVARQIFFLLERNISGIFNCVNQGYASRYEYVSEIYRLSKIDVDVIPVDSSSFSRLANVSDNESAINDALQHIGMNKMPSWRKSLEDYIAFLNLHSHIEK